ncbi:MAG: dihydroorotase [Pseudomonadales bacterium]|nr:dihydroorotase [Pseudomonadales bacterium]
MSTLSELTLRRPDDWHIHLRDGEVLSRTVADAAAQFGRCIVMPNLLPPVINTVQALAYRERILKHVPEGANLEPLMVLYLTDKTTAADIHEAHQSGLVKAVKLYPAGATTNSDSGVTDILACGDVFAAMQEVDMPLLVHGEVTDHHIDIFDREAEFIERILTPLTQQFPELRVVLEHITTAQAVEFVKQAPANIAATITAHHLLFNRNDMLVGGIRPHYFCLPILKRSTHQQALLEAATSGNKKFFLGTDSAPHATDKKEAACGCAGAYTAYAAIELYATAFEQMQALDKLEGFASLFGPEFYGLDANTQTITLTKQSWTAPEALSFGDSSLTPLLAGEEITWQVTGK